MRILHLTASPFFGGPERVILDLVRTQSAPDFEYTGHRFESVIATFGENGGCAPFLGEIEKTGLEGLRLVSDMPRLDRAVGELMRLLRGRRTDLVCAHGHKSRAVGWVACRRIGIPIIGVSHGWTWQDFRTSVYERIDQWMHRRMDTVVAVSRGQAEKIIRTGTPPGRVHVVYNAIDPGRFDKAGEMGAHSRAELEKMFEGPPPAFLFGAAGRLSPEKGYDVLIDAFAQIIREGQESGHPDTGLILFGEGASRLKLQEKIDRHGIGDRFRLAGFTSELDRFLPCFDGFVQSSRTEGFPCVNLEAMAAGVPVVATRVGGVPEQIEDGVTGLLVPPDDPESLAAALRRLIGDPALHAILAETARESVRSRFTCAVQAERYAAIFARFIR